MRAKFLAIFLTMVTLWSIVAYADIAIDVKARINHDLAKFEQKIYTVSVEGQDKKAPASQYLVLFFLDDVFVREFQNQTIPFSFDVNLDGQLEGSHDIRIDVEDGHDNILASATTRININEHGN